MAWKQVSLDELACVAELKKIKAQELRLLMESLNEKSEKTALAYVNYVRNALKRNAA